MVYSHTIITFEYVYFLFIFTLPIPILPTQAEWVYALYQGEQEMIRKEKKPWLDVDGM